MAEIMAGRKLNKNLSSLSSEFMLMLFLLTLELPLIVQLCWYRIAPVPLKSKTTHTACIKTTVPSRMPDRFVVPRISDYRFELVKRPRRT